MKRMGHPPRAPGKVSPYPRQSTLHRKDARWALLFVAPTALGLAVFCIWPTFQTFYYSFTTWGPFGGHDWSGLDNYRELFTDPELRNSLISTAIFTIVTLLSVPIGMVVAVLLNRPGMRGLGLYRTIYFLPTVTLPASIAIMWKMLYNGDYGAINWALGLIHIHGTSWLANPDTAIYAVAVVSVWGSIGYNMVLFIAGMQVIPRTLYEAAELDGAGRVAQFRHITIPLLSPTIFFVTVITIIGALQAFDLVYMMIGKSNPALAKSETVVFLFFHKAFLDSQGGYAAAIAFLLLTIILVFTSIQFRMQKRWVHYE